MGQRSTLERGCVPRDSVTLELSSCLADDWIYLESQPGDPYT